jgi:hypothetical protein
MFITVCLVTVNCVAISAVSDVLYFVMEMDLCAVHTYWTLLVKLVALLGFVQIHENCRVEGGTVGAGRCAIVLHVYMKLWHLGSKECLGLCDVHHVQPCFTWSGSK